MDLSTAFNSKRGVYRSDLEKFIWHLRSWCEAHQRRETRITRDGREISTLTCYKEDNCPMYNSGLCYCEQDTPGTPRSLHTPKQWDVPGFRRNLRNTQVSNTIVRSRRRYPILEISANEVPSFLSIDTDRIFDPDRLERRDEPLL